jgi:hypothetical protein
VEGYSATTKKHTSPQWLNFRNTSFETGEGRAVSVKYHECIPGVVKVVDFCNWFNDTMVNAEVLEL